MYYKKIHPIDEIWYFRVQLHPKIYIISGRPLPYVAIQRVMSSSYNVILYMRRGLGKSVVWLIVACFILWYFYVNINILRFRTLLLEQPVSQSNQTRPEGTIQFETYPQKNNNKTTQRHRNKNKNEEELYKIYALHFFFSKLLLQWLYFRFLSQEKKCEKKPSHALSCFAHSNARQRSMD